MDRVPFLFTAELRIITRKPCITPPRNQCLSAGRGEAHQLKARALPVQQFRQTRVCCSQRETFLRRASERVPKPGSHLAVGQQLLAIRWATQKLNPQSSTEQSAGTRYNGNMPVILAWLRKLKLKQLKELQFSLRRQSPGPHPDLVS